MGRPWKWWHSKSAQELPCARCAIKSDDLAVANSTPCERWCQQWQKEGKPDDHPNWRHCHDPMVASARIAGICEQGEQIQLQLVDLAEKLVSLSKISKINCVKDPGGVGEGNSILDPMSTRFDHTRANQTDKSGRLASLTHDLAIRNSDATGSINKMQER